MGLRSTFLEVIEAVRDECGVSNNSARGIDFLETIKRLIKRHYITQAEEYTWQHLELKRKSAISRVVLAAGQTLYDFPAAVNVQKIKEVYTKLGNRWLDVNYGITYTGHRSIFDPDNNAVRTTPVTNWMFSDENQFEVWPTPSVNGVADGSGEIAFTGQKITEKLIVDGDRMDMDEILVSLLAASEILGGWGKRIESAIKAEAAVARRDFLRLGMGTKTRYIMNSGTLNEDAHIVRHPLYIPYQP